jgi:hypothetical protein
MASKEERERRRAERLAAEQAQASAERRRLLIGYVVAGVLGAAVLGGIVVAVTGSGGGDDNNLQNGNIDPADHPNMHYQPTGGIFDVTPDDREGTPPPDLQQGDLQQAAASANCDLQLDLPDEGNTHLAPDDPVPDYKTNPPTSGNHDPNPQADGAYSEEPEPVHFVHSLEHGRIEIQYSPDLPKEDQLALKGVFDESPDGVLLFPNPDMPYEVAATAWTQLIGCKKYEGAATLDAIRDFRDIYRGQGPETQVAISF